MTTIPRLLYYSEDTDVCIQAAYVSHQLRGDLLIKRKGDLINCRDMLAEKVTNAIIPLHVVTGVDHTSGFFGHEKKRLLQMVMDDAGARKLLRQVGESLELLEEVKDNM